MHPRATRRCTLFFAGIFQTRDPQISLWNAEHEEKLSRLIACPRHEEQIAKMTTCSGRTGSLCARCARCMATHRHMHHSYRWTVNVSSRNNELHRSLREYFDTPRQVSQYTTETARPFEYIGKKLESVRRSSPTKKTKHVDNFRFPTLNRNNPNSRPVLLNKVATSRGQGKRRIHVK